jgi:hypothetical protein
LKPVTVERCIDTTRRPLSEKNRIVENKVFKEKLKSIRMKHARAMKRTMRVIKVSIGLRENATHKRGL